MQTKQVFLMLIFFISLNIAHAQVEDIINNNSLTSGELLIIDDNLYYSYGFSIAKYNLTNNTNSLAITLSGRPHALKRVGDEIYATINSGNTIIKFNHLEPNPIAETVLITPENAPLRLQLNGNEMYCNHGIPNDTFFKFNINQTNPTIEYFDWPSETSANGIIFINNVLYAALSTDNRIIKFDLNQENPVLEEIFNVSDGLNFVHSLIKIGAYIYVSDTNANKISRFDYNSSNPELELVIEGPIIDGPLTMEYKNSLLYVNLRDTKKIVSIDLGVLSLNDFQISQKSLFLSPNPVNNILNLRNLEYDAIASIYDTNGKLILNAVRLDPANNSIFLPNLQSGVYVLKIVSKTSSEAIRFIKK